MPDPEYLVRVTGRTQKGERFTAAIVMRGDKCIRAAPILARCQGKDRYYLRTLFRDNGWTATIKRSAPCQK